MATKTYDIMAARLSDHGLLLRGGFYPGEGDTVPPGVKTVLLVGNAGPAMWAAFSGHAAGAQDPLDQWTRDIVNPLAVKFNGAAHYPGDGPPYWPFQTWAQRADNVAPSPIGILMHPDFGLWHAYRAAIALPDRVDLPPVDTRPSPCDRCVDKPCLTACPVNAFHPDGYDVPACTTHIATDDKRQCRALGCAARRACPVSTPYAPAQAAFHMVSFLKNFAEG